MKEVAVTARYRGDSTRIWILWTIVAAVVSVTARNPLYSLLILIITQIVARMFGQETGQRSFPLARIVMIILLFSVIFNAMSVHVGSTVLFRLPTTWPLVGGPITLEAAVYGFTSGMMLVTMLAVFVTFNQLVPSSELVRLMPRALRDLGIVILIAVTYVPETSRQLSRIRDAQAIRGHQMRGFKDWRPIIIPLLIGGMERAMSVAETMVSRGYGATSSANQPLSIQLSLVAGLLMTLIGWFLTYWIAWVGYLLLLAGAALIGALAVRLGRMVPHTKYRTVGWVREDWIMVAASAASLLIIWLPLPFVSRDTLSYIPYPILHLPALDPVVAAAILGLLLPIYLLKGFAK